MLKRDEILKYFSELNDILRKDSQLGEIGIVGGAAMCLVYKSRASTRDVDAIFEPSSVIRDAAARVGTKYKLPKDWLNDGAKGFLAENFKREVFLNLSNLSVWAPETSYMLAMKCISARWDSLDKDDVIFLMNQLKIKTAEEVFQLIESYYPKNLIPPKTQFFIEEILSNR